MESGAWAVTGGVWVVGRVEDKLWAGAEQE